MCVVFSFFFFILHSLLCASSFNATASYFIINKKGQTKSTFHSPEATPPPSQKHFFIVKNRDFSTPKQSVLINNGASLTRFGRFTSVK